MEDNTIDSDSIFLKKKDSISSEPMTSIYPNMDSPLSEDVIDALEEERNSLRRLYEKYEKLPVRPYFGIVDLNNDQKTPYENKPKMSIEGGLVFKF